MGAQIHSVPALTGLEPVWSSARAELHAPKRNRRRLRWFESCWAREPNLISAFTGLERAAVLLDAKLHTSSKLLEWVKNHTGILRSEARRASVGRELVRFHLVTLC